MLLLSRSLRSHDFVVRVLLVLLAVVVVNGIGIEQMTVAGAVPFLQQDSTLAALCRRSGRFALVLALVLAL